MDRVERLTHLIVQDAVSDRDMIVYFEPQVGNDELQNELLLFVKPEIFAVDDPDKSHTALDLVFSSLNVFNAEVRGLVIVGGSLIEQANIMVKHYGYINTLSTRASEILTDVDRERIRAVLKLASIRDYRILGGHEYLLAHPGMTLPELKAVWSPEKSVKVRSGFYCHTLGQGKKGTILVNGFHPTQLAHYTGTDRRVLLILIHSDTDWEVLRDHMIGSTFPDRARPGSIRNELYKSPGKYGLKSVSIENNGVHLSAGPFEAGFEILNFFGSIPLSISADLNPLIIWKLQQRLGCSRAKALSVIDNPVLQFGENSIDLFTATECMNTETAIDWLMASGSWAKLE